MHKYAVQGDTYSDLAHNCISAPQAVIAMSLVKVLFHDFVDFFKSLLTGGDQPPRSGPDSNQQGQTNNPYASAGYDSPEDYAAYHQEADLRYSNAQAAPTWAPFFQSDERSTNGKKPLGTRRGHDRWHF